MCQCRCAMVALCEIGAKGHQAAITYFGRVRVDRWQSASQSQVCNGAPMIEESVFGEEDHGLRPSRYGFVECGREAGSGADLFRGPFYSGAPPRLPGTFKERSHFPR